MKISIASGEKTICIRVPSRLIFNSVTATVAGPAILAKSLKNGTGEAPLPDRRTARVIFREIDRCRRRFPGWALVEAGPEDRPTLRIQL